MDTIPRKRPSSPVTSGSSSVKKRALASASGSPAASTNAELPDERERDPQAENLESFRKQALFRRMRQHDRERKRAETRVNELEHRKRVLEAAMAAIENCWNHIIDQLQTIVNIDSLRLPTPPNVIDFRKLIEEKSAHDVPGQEFHDALVIESTRTQNIVAAFVTMASPRSTPDAEEAVRRLQQTTAEATSLRSQLRIVRAEYADARDQLDRYKELLSKAETLSDRARLEALRLGGAPQLEVKTEDSSSRQTPELLTPYVNGASKDYSAEIASLVSQAERREAEITRLAKQKSEFIVELRMKDAKINSFSEEFIWTHPTYIALLEEVSSLREVSEDLKKSQKAVQENTKQRVGTLQTLLYEHRTLLYNQEKEHDERIKAKNQQIAKAKDQREAALKDLAIAKAGESSKSSLRETMQTRMTSLEDRIASLLLETKRLKLQLGVQHSQEDYLSFMLSKPDESVSFIDDLRSKLSTAQANLSALESVVSRLDESNPSMAKHLRAEAEAREECVHLRKKLAEFQSMFGEHATTAVGKLAAVVEEKEQQIKTLKLAQQQEAAVSNDLFDELGRMSSAWEILDKESKARQDESVAWESKFSKLSVEKAKAEQKYFAAMREKEAIDAERKAVLKNATKHAATIAKLTDQEKLLQDEAMSMREVVSTYQHQGELYEAQLSAKESALHQKTVSLESLQKQVQALEQGMKEAEQESEANLHRARKVEDELTQLKQSTSKEISKLTQTPTAVGAATPKEEELQNEVQNLMTILRCSTCKQDFKSHVLLKCMHTFCKSCIDARLTTRQRKCPACNMKFQDSDVQPLYFQ